MSFQLHATNFSRQCKCTNFIQRKPCNQNNNNVCPVQLKLCWKCSLSSDTGIKTGAPLLHCSVSDVLISRILRCKNVSTKLINVLDLTFVPIFNPLWRNLLRIPCTKNYYYYYYHHFGYMQQLTLRVSQGTVATFYRCGGQNRNCLGQIFSGFFVSKIMKIGSFLTELLKN